MPTRKDPDDPARLSTISKRRLASELLRLRIKLGRTANQVSDRLGWGRGKLGRIEANEWVKPVVEDVEDLLRVYRVNEGSPQHSLMMNLTARARLRPWWRRYSSSIFSTEFVGYEEGCRMMKLYSPLFIPSLLQSEAYSLRRVKSGRRGLQFQQDSHETLMRRQEILERPKHAPVIHAIIEEASLAYVWGTAEERREQIHHLIDLGERPHIHLRLAQFAGGWHAAMGTVYSLFEFAAPSAYPPVGFAENDLNTLEVSDEKLDYLFGTFEETQRAALSPEETVDYLKRLSDEL